MADKERTRREIVDSLVELTETTPFDKVTVAQVCERAQLSRQTFYQYFRDKYDVAVQIANSAIADDFRQLGSTIGWHEAYLRSFRRMEQLGLATARLSESDDYNSIPQTMERSARRDFTERYRERYGCDPSPLIAFQIDAVAHLGTVVPQRWVESGLALSADQLADYFVTLIPRELFEALDVGEGAGAAAAPVPPAPPSA